MKTTCEIIKDLLPLYYDGVCSAESRVLVEEHINECSSCEKLLSIISEELAHPVIEPDEAKPMEHLRAVWKKEKAKSFIKGILIVIMVCAAIAICAYILYSPRPVIKTPYSMAFSVQRTYEYNDDGTLSGSGMSYKTFDDDFAVISRIMYRGEDVTDRFDETGVIELFGGCLSRRTSRQTGSADDILWEIEITRKNGPIHIYLGQKDAYTGNMLYYWYQSGPHYQILDPAALMNSLEQMMGTKQNTISPYTLQGSEYKLGRLLFMGADAHIFSFTTAEDYKTVSLRCDEFRNGEPVSSSVPLKCDLEDTFSREGMIAVLFNRTSMQLSLTKTISASSAWFELDSEQVTDGNGSYWADSQGMPGTADIEDNKEIKLFVYASDAGNSRLYPPDRFTENPDLISQYDYICIVTSVFSK